jgi:hypothetical protein
MLQSAANIPGAVTILDALHPNLDSAPPSRYPLFAPKLAHRMAANQNQKSFIPYPEQPVILGFAFAAVYDLARSIHHDLRVGHLLCLAALVDLFQHSLNVLF